MTKEEAINELEEIAEMTIWNYRRLAVNMAIEALQAKMDGDAISRQDALKPFCVAPDGTRIPEVDCDNFPVEFSVEFIKKHLLSLPSAPDSRQRGEWVGCTGCEHYDQQQTALICRDCKRYYRDMYEDGDKVMVMGKDKI